MIKVIKNKTFKALVKCESRSLFGWGCARVGTFEIVHPTERNIKTMYGVPLDYLIGQHIKEGAIVEVTVKIKEKDLDDKYSLTTLELKKI